MPQLWGKDQVDAFSNTINNTIANGDVTAVLGFNEYVIAPSNPCLPALLIFTKFNTRPQETGQSNLTPQEGASLWLQYIQPLKSQGIRLGTPAPSSNPNGKTWIQDWLSACNGSCTPDFVALRESSAQESSRMKLIINVCYWVDYYDVNATVFQSYLEDFHNTFNLPIWVTELADQVN